MKIIKGMVLVAGLVMTFQAGAAVRPETAKLQLTPGMQAATRLGAPTRAAKQNLGGEALLPAVLAAAVVAGGVVVATKNHDGSPLSVSP